MKPDVIELKVDRGILYKKVATAFAACGYYWILVSLAPYDGGV